MADIAIFRINYKSDFVLTLHSDAGWLTPFCIKFWTGAPSQAYFAGYDGTNYTHCAPVDGEPTKLRVQFDDHHLPIGDLMFQIGYHFTVADFPTSVEDEVLNQASVIIEVDDAPAQVMLDLNGETAPEIEFSLPAYANEAQRIANEEQRINDEQQRISNEEGRISAEEGRQAHELQRIHNEETRIEEFAQLKADAISATGAANNAATLANDKADLAQQKADYAQTQGDYAKAQGDYAKAQGDYAKAQGDTALADHERAEADHDTSTEDHTQASSDHDRAESDHSQAAQDHDRAESDHAAVEVYVDSLGAFDISSYHATGGVLAKYADLTAALGTNGANIPDALRKGGMSVKFVLSSDNKYVQARCMAQNFTTDVTQWQGVDDEPIAGSKNIVESGGVEARLNTYSLLSENAYDNLIDVVTSVPVVNRKQGLHVIYRDSYDYVHEVQFVGTSVEGWGALVLWEELSPTNIKYNTENGRFVIVDIYNNIALEITQDGKLKALLDNNIVKSENIADNAISNRNITDNSIAGSKIENGTIGTDKIENDAITIEKLCSDLQWVADFQGESDDLLFRIADGLGYIAFRINSDGKTDADLSLDTFINAWNNYKDLIDVNKKDYEDLLPPPYLFTATNYCYSDNVANIKRGYAPVLYLDRMVKLDENGNPPELVFIGGSSSFRIGNSGISSGNIIQLSAKNKVVSSRYNDIAIEIPLYCSKNTNLLNKKLNILCIGDSETDAGEWPNYMRKLVLMDNIDYKKKTSTNVDVMDVHLIGTRHDANHETFTYREENVSVHNYNEGMSGWTSYSYLHHAKNYAWANYAFHCAWRELGLYELYNVEYNGSVEHNTFIMNTCSGYHTITSAAINERVWNNNRAEIGLPNVAFNDATSEQIALMVTYFNTTLPNNPKNPFFSVDMVNATDGEYAFSWSAYYAKYKNYDESGNPLPAGEQGSSVISNSYVCVPDYVMMNLGTNDFAGTQSSAVVAQNVFNLANAIHSQIGCPVILFNSAVTGRYYMSAAEDGFADYANMYSGNKYYELAESLYELAGTLTEQATNGIYFCPAYWLQRFGATVGYSYVGIGEDDKVLGNVILSTDVHPNKLAYDDWAYQLYSMLNYIER